MGDNKLEKIKKLKKDIDSTLSSIDIDDVKLDFVTLRIGDKIVKLKKVSDEPIDIINEVKDEYKQKITDKLSKISDIVNDNLLSALQLTDSIKQEYDRKEKDLKSKLLKALPMPEVTYDHAVKGLSITKGQRVGKLMWYVRRTYFPKFLDRRPIKQRTIKKMITPIIIMIETLNNKITGVSTRKITNLDYFEHYHQSNPDCWGNWKWNTEWKTPEDIIAVADEAMSVLENINGASLAMSSPRRLPRISTIRRNLEPTDNTVELPNITQIDNIVSSVDQVWSTT